MRHICLAYWRCYDVFKIMKKKEQEHAFPAKNDWKLLCNSLSTVRIWHADLGVQYMSMASAIACYGQCASQQWVCVCQYCCTSSTGDANRKSSKMREFRVWGGYRQPGCAFIAEETEVNCVISVLKCPLFNIEKKKSLVCLILLWSAW